MPRFVLHVGATVRCAHGGAAQPIASSPRVLVNGHPAVTIESHYVISGCPNPPPPAGSGPCATAIFIMAATRVFVTGNPVLLHDSRSVCQPTGTPLLPAVTQTRVSAM